MGRRARRRGERATRPAPRLGESCPGARPASPRSMPLAMPGERILSCGVSWRVRAGAKPGGELDSSVAPQRPTGCDYTSRQSLCPCPGTASACAPGCRRQPHSARFPTPPAIRPERWLSLVSCFVPHPHLRNRFLIRPHLFLRAIDFFGFPSVFAQKNLRGAYGHRG